MTARIVALVLTLGLLGAGCTDDADPGFEGLPSPDPSPTASASAEALPSPTADAVAAVDPTVVPPVEEMTAEYVEAVVNTIEAESGKLFARVLAEPVNPIGALPDGVHEGLEALYAGDSLELNIVEAEALAESEEARALALPAEQYTGVRYDILQVSYAEPGCLIAVGRINRDGSSREGGDDPALSFLSLVPANADIDRKVNPTPWKLTESVANTSSDGSVNPDEFAFSATLQEMEGVIANSCEEGEASRVEQ